MTEVKIPRRVSAIVSKLASGQTLHYDFNVKKTGRDNDRFWLEPSQKNVAPKSVRKAIELGLIVPAGDCLFSDTPSQTYRLAGRA